MKLRNAIVGSVLTVVGIWLGSNIVRSCNAPSAALPRDADIITAERTLSPATGIDERVEVPIGNHIGGNGVIEPARRETRVAAQGTGRIAKVLVKEGDAVAIGDVLAELESSVQVALLAAAEADVKAAEAEYARTARGNRTEDVEASIADADAATARARSSEATATRLKQAAVGGGATPDEVERAVRQAEMDRAAAALADARRRAARNGSRAEDVAAARARLDAATSRRDRELAAIEDLKARSPIAGQVLSLPYNEGEYYSPGAGEPLAIVGDLRQLRARIDVDERDIGRLALGANAIVRAPAFPGRDFPARVVELGLRMGRKNVRSDDPVERNDAKILEVVAQLERPEALVVGQRVTGWIAPQ